MGSHGAKPTALRIKNIERALLVEVKTHLALLSGFRMWLGQMDLEWTLIIFCVGTLLLLTA